MKDKKTHKYVYPVRLYDELQIKLYYTFVQALILSPQVT